MALSSDPAARAMQVANLEPAPVGNVRTVKHGGHRTHKTLPADGAAAAIFDVLADETPLRDGDGGLPAVDRTAVELLASCLARLKPIGEYLHKHGPLDSRGRPRPVLEVERRLRNEARDALRELGMTPRARVALGIALQRGAEFDLAQVLSDLEDDRG